MESLLQYDIYNKFPFFSPNQVLTDTQLNHLRAFLDQQNRLTRIRTIGCGIVCGLKAWHAYDQNGQNFVRICEGYGISSSGFLLELHVSDARGFAEYTYYRNYEITDLDADEIEDNQWLAKILAKKDIKVLELINLEDDQTGLGISKQDDNMPVAIDKEKLKGMTLVLLLKKTTEEMDPCVVTACNNQGDNIAYKLCPILVSSSEFKIKEDKTPQILCEALHVPSLASGIKLGLHDGLAKSPDRIEDCIYSLLFDELPQQSPTHRLGIAYGCVVEYMREELKKRIVAGYTWFKKLLNLKIDISEIEICLDDQLGKEKDAEYTQYYFDYVRDLACAWNEFLVAVKSLIPYCFSENKYPCHLVLGSFEQGSGTECKVNDTYRSHFEPSPASNVLYGKLDYSRKLFLRLTKMVGAFSQEIADNGSIQLTTPFEFKTLVTPSQKEHFPLGDRAVPYYYLYQGSDNARNQFKSYWQPYQKNTIEPVLDYYRHLGKEDPVYTEFPNPYETWPQSYTHHKNTFFRIEGHLKNSITRVYEALIEQKNLYNLDFSIVVLCLEDVNSTALVGLRTNYNALTRSFLGFAHRHCGMIHTGGVCPGGTFILVIDGADTVVADFSIDGYIDCLCDNCFISLEISEPTLDPNSEMANVTLTILKNDKDPTPATYSINWKDDSGPDVGASNVRSHNYRRLPDGVDQTYEIDVAGIMDDGGTCTASISVLIPGLEAASPAPPPTGGPQGFAKISFDTPKVKKETTRSVSPPPPQKSVNLSLSRRRIYLQEVMGLNGRNEFAKNRTFQTVMGFLSKEPTSSSAVSEDLKEIIAKATAQTNRKSTPQAKRIAYQIMMEKSLQLYADTLVNNDPNRISAKDAAMLKEAIQDMKNAGINLSKLAQNWQTPEILQTSTGKKIKGMMK